MLPWGTQRPPPSPIATRYCVYIIAIGQWCAATKNNPTIGFGGMELFKLIQ